MSDFGLKTQNGGLVPLQGVEIVGEVLGGHASLTVRQRYQNQEAQPVEAVYTFPLPADATLTAFSMTCAGRSLEGEVKEKEEAFRTYDDAVTAGHGAALLEQERTNVFTASVGNLLPGEETLIEVTYVQKVRADEGALRLAIPTLVAPRYIPGTPQGSRTGHGWADPTDQVPDADRITPPIGQVDYGLTLEVSFALGRAVVVESPSHALSVVDNGEGRTTARFAQADVALDRDVILLVRGATDEPLVTLATHRAAGEEGAFALTVVPDLFSMAQAPGQDVVFVIDTSGSMGGLSIQEARSALTLCLRHLRENDRFNIIEFNSNFTTFQPAPVPFNQANLSAADKWVKRLDANGGTELLRPMLEATKAVPDGVVVLLTDGEVGNEAEILRAVLAARKGTRVYSFGIGTNVSDALLRDLARQTGGAVEFIYPGERIDEKVVAQFAKALSPRVTDVKVTFEGISVGELAPAVLGSLVDGEPFTLYGRYDQAGTGKVEVRGTLRQEPFVLSVPLELPELQERPAVLKLWASERIRDLEGMEVAGRRADTMKQRIVELAVKYKVSSRFTSFVVVEKRSGDRRTSGVADTRVVPVNAPFGWDMFKDQADKVDRKKKSAPRPSAPASVGAGSSVPYPPSARAFTSATGFPVRYAAPPPPPAPAPSGPGVDETDDASVITGSFAAYEPAPTFACDAPMAESNLEFEEHLRQVPDGASGPMPIAARNRKVKGMFNVMKELAESAVAKVTGRPDQAEAKPIGASASTPGAMPKPMPAQEQEKKDSSPELMRSTRFAKSQPAMSRDEAPAEVAAMPADPVSLLSRQLASGLWEEGSGDVLEKQLRGTARALSWLRKQGIDASHALYGGQVKKAVDALLALAPTAQAYPELLARALALAWLVSSGHRTRSRLQAAAKAAPGLETLAAALGNETTAQAWLEAAGD